jgi:hypothetical protein
VQQTGAEKQTNKQSKANFAKKTAGPAHYSAARAAGLL